jgi:hypothetical protein
MDKIIGIDEFCFYYVILGSSFMCWRPWREFFWESKSNAIKWEELQTFGAKIFSQRSFCKFFASVHLMSQRYVVFDEKFIIYFAVFDEKMWTIHFRRCGMRGRTTGSTRDVLFSKKPWRTKLPTHFIYFDWTIKLFRAKNSNVCTLQWTLKI